jgi:GNAT superfamily N-acetyltransferase
MTVDRMVIRDYEPGDARALMALFHRTVHTVCAADYTPEQLAAWSPAAGQQLERWSRRFAIKRPFVATNERGPVGFLELEPDGHIDGMYVHSEVQRQRVGTRLLQHAITQARRWGLRRIHAEVSITALPFFRRHGFQLIRNQEVERHGQRLRNSVMELQLDAGPG